MTLEQIERKNKVFLSATVDSGIKEARDRAGDMNQSAKIKNMDLMIHCTIR
jgi:hypothetical protein